MVFKEIETPPIEFNKYRVQLLFSYRSICGELRKKQKSQEVFKRILNANSFKGMSNYSRLDSETRVEGYEIGINDIKRLMNIMEDEIYNNAIPNFTFSTYTYDLIQVCASAMFSPIQPGSDAISKAANQGEPLSNVFINVIPQQNNLYIIVGITTTG
jgi:hypothetical protein